MERGRGVPPLTDFGLQHVALEPWDEVHPATLDDLRELVTEARRDGRGLRMRGHGHSLNGSAVPQPGEILVRTDRLQHFRCERRGTITVGAGVTMWDLRDFVGQYGWRLPIWNNGNSGPTVGGFVAAGGLGADSIELGGFWENVHELSAVDGTGQAIRIGGDDPELPWWFGAMGRLGMLHEATLALVPASTVSPRDLPSDGVVPQLNPREAPRYVMPGQASQEQFAYWVTVLTPPSREAEAMGDLDALRARHQVDLEWLPIFTYRMVHRGRVAPLVHGRPEDFLALFLWAKLRAADPRAPARIQAIEQEFGELVFAKGYSRYHQTELVAPTFDFARYYGARIWDHFRALRDRRDPDAVLNRGVLGLR